MKQLQKLHGAKILSKKEQQAVKGGQKSAVCNDCPERHYCSESQGCLAP